jgi:hypothetical protein
MLALLLLEGFFLMISDLIEWMNWDYTSYCEVRGFEDSGTGYIIYWVISRFI